VRQKTGPKAIMKVLIQSLLNSESLFYRLFWTSEIILGYLV